MKIGAFFGLGVFINDAMRLAVFKLQKLIGDSELDFLLRSSFMNSPEESLRSYVTAKEVYNDESRIFLEIPPSIFWLSSNGSHKC